MDEIEFGPEFQKKLDRYLRQFDYAILTQELVAQLRADSQTLGFLRSAYELLDDEDE